MTAEEARARLAGARVAHLATASVAGRPHVVPCSFALLDDHTIVSAVDHKPKRTTALRRLRNVTENPRVALLADHYDDRDWDALWWVRADGAGRVLAPEEPEARRAVEALRARYAQYGPQPPRGPVLAVDVDRWTGWLAAPPVA